MSPGPAVAGYVSWCVAVAVNQQARRRKHGVNTKQGQQCPPNEAKGYIKSWHLTTMRTLDICWLSFVKPFLRSVSAAQRMPRLSQGREPCRSQSASCGLDTAHGARSRCCPCFSKLRKPSRPLRRTGIPMPTFPKARWARGGCQ